MVKWTTDQQKAIDARNNNLLVAAAAGSGKTAVLVERIIHLILKDRVNIDQLLIVTFTNAAAGEMRERIGTAILQEMEKKNQHEEHLQQQINLLNKSSISTIHSFCMDVIGRYFHLLDIDPNFRIADSTETAILKMEVMEELLEREYEKADPIFLGLIERFGGSKTDEPLQEIILHLYDFIQSKPYPLTWLTEKVEDFKMSGEQLKESLWYQGLMEQLSIELTGAKKIFEEAWRFTQIPGGPAEYRDILAEDIQLVVDLQDALKKGLFTFYTSIGQVNHRKLSRAAKETDEDLKEEVKGLREQGKKILKEIQESYLFQSPDEFIEDLNQLYPYMLYLANIVAAFQKLYQKKKQERSLVDFNDLEHYALAILENDQAAKEYREKYQYIFIDEYQDSNIVQETILSFIKRERNLFMVGDVKQSIYRFRLADPSLFIEKYQSFATTDAAVNRRIDLKKNFRSRKEIIDGVNYIFRHLMSKAFGEIDYDENAWLYQGAETYPMEDSEIEVHFVEKKPADERLEEELLELEDVEVEAKITAKRIKAWVGKQIYDAKAKRYRSVTYRDMVVLLRTTKNWAQTFTEMLTKEGIPVYADVNEGYFQALEINIFLNLLKIIDNKRQDIPLLSVMRSVIGQFSVEELIEIRTKHPKKSFFEAIEAYIGQESDSLGKKLIYFLKKLESWKAEAKYMQLDDFIWKLFMDTGYYHYVGAMPDGINRQANLRMLIERARQYQKSSIKGLFNFITFIDKLKESSGDMGTAKTLGENQDVVRIMSIHKSKGLEFPVVIVAGLGKPFNLSDANEPVLFHKDLGLGPKYVNPELRQYTDTIAKIVVKKRIRLESLSEEMRILYVALTRAKEKLILIGSIKDLTSSIKGWKTSLSAYHLSKGKHYLDWLGPVLLKHEDGNKLREWAELDWPEGKLEKDPSKWKIYRWSKADIQWEESQGRWSKEDFDEHIKIKLKDHPSEYNFVEQRLNWRYPYEMATRIPSKLSVTEIKKLSGSKLNSLGMNIPSLVKMPKFMEGKKQFSAIEKGTIMHFVMQHLDLLKVTSKEQIENQIEEMIHMELLKREEAETVESSKILTFFQTNIGRRILKAKDVYREVPFNLVKKAEDVIPNMEHVKDNLLIQGVIDLYFAEDDGWVLVDYKTDYLEPEKKQVMIDRYQVQIELYKEALERITGKSVRESYLYLFHIDQEVRL